MAKSVFLGAEGADSGARRSTEVPAEALGQTLQALYSVAPPPPSFTFLQIIIIKCEKVEYMFTSKCPLGGFGERIFFFFFLIFLKEKSIPTVISLSHWLAPPKSHWIPWCDDVRAGAAAAILQP